LIVDSPAPGAWNMAVDEALLLRAAEGDVGTLRFYRWSEPTLSLGYFQSQSDCRQHSASAGCAIVRRQTGGGAILHDRELTYSLTLPAGQPPVRNAEQLYRTVHGAFVAALQPLLTAAGDRWSMEVRAADSPLPKTGEPFLCFVRRARGDVLLTRTWPSDSPRLPDEPVKIVGSAQRRHRGAILQHGSLLLETSPFAPELPGLRDCTGLAISADQLISELASRIGQALESRLIESPLPDALWATVCRLRTEKYESPDWTFRR
jgi:lipoate-protein ligase A